MWHNLLNLNHLLMDWIINIKGGYLFTHVKVFKKQVYMNIPCTLHINSILIIKSSTYLKFHY